MIIPKETPTLPWFGGFLSQCLISLFLTSATRGDSLSRKDPTPAAAQFATLLSDRILPRGYKDQVVPE
jgi:hypothetical protein